MTRRGRWAGRRRPARRSVEDTAPLEVFAPVGRSGAFRRLYMDRATLPERVPGAAPATGQLTLNLSGREHPPGDVLRVTVGRLPKDPVPGWRCRVLGRWYAVEGIWPTGWPPERLQVVLSPASPPPLAPPDAEVDARVDAVAGWR